MLFCGSPNLKLKNESNFCYMCAWECHVGGDTDLRVQNCYVKQIKCEQIYDIQLKNAIYRENLSL